jgi:hypothetical protein
MSDTFEGTSPHISDRYITREIAGEILTMGQVVELTADQTVRKPATVPGVKYCGVCLTSAALGKSVSVLWRGRARAKAYGTITAGDLLSAGPGGTIQTLAILTATDLTGTSAAIATILNQHLAFFAFCEIGAASGASAVIFIV